MTQTENIYQSITRQLSRFRRRKKLLLMLGGFLSWIGGAIVLLLLTVGAEAILRFDPSARTGLAVAVGVLLIVSWLVLIVWPLVNLVFLRKRPDDVGIALEVGGLYGDLGDRLANALQVYLKRSHNPERYSKELMNETLWQVGRNLEGEDFSQRLDSSRTRRIAQVTVSVICVATILFLVLWTPLGAAFGRVIHPRTVYEVASRVSLSVQPGDIEILRGEDVQVRVQAAGAEKESATLFHRRYGSSTPQRQEMRAENADEYSFKLEGVRDSTYYYVTVKSVTSPEYLISVVDLPMVRNLRVRIHPPDYSGLPNQFLDNDVGDVIALKGTRVFLSALANKSVGNASLVFSTGQEEPLKVSGRRLDGGYVVSQDCSYHVSLRDDEGRMNADPVEYRITVLPDRSPVVGIPVPGMDVDIGEDMLLPLTIEAEDDFGISRARLCFQHLREGIALSDTEEEEQFQDLSTDGNVADKLRLNYVWDMSQMGMIPEDVVLYCVEVFDNDAVSGPKSARSIEYRVRFPSIYEIYQDVAQRHEETFEVLEEVYDQSKALRERLEDFVQQMKKNPELDWGERKEVEEAVETQERLREQLEELSRNLDEMIEQMERNDLVTLETLEKYRELQRLFQEVATPELRKAMEEVQKALQDIDPTKLKQAIEKFDINQEDFLESIERTIALLKRLQIEQKLDEAVRKAADLVHRQEEINQDAENRKGPADELAEQQQAAAQDVHDLDKQLDELSQQMSEFPDMPRDKIESATTEIDSTQLASQMQQLGEMLSQQDFQKAHQKGRKVAGALQQVSQTLQAAQKELSDNQRKEMMLALQKVSHNLLRLSERQEELMKETRRATADSPQMPELADRQEHLKAGLDRVASQLYELAQKTFYVAPQIGSAIGQAHDNMRRSVSSLETRNSSASANQQAHATMSLNEAVKQMLQAMQDISSGTSGLGLDAFLQRLQNMAGAQEGINQETLAFGPGGQFSLEQQAAMARLAAEQEALRKSLEELQREMGRRSEILGRLNQVGGDMEEVVQDLQARKVDQRTVDRQRRILSRLLDSQKSVRERDFSRKRQARAGTNVARRSPGALPEDLGEQQNRLQQDLLRAKKEGYTHDYLELIKQYFEALVREEKGNGCTQ